jgi:predicted RNA-binding Zn ribbon-like protein
MQAVTTAVDELPLRGNDLSVDFVNTVADVRTGLGEHVPTPADLAGWGLHAGALSEAEYEAVSAVIEGDPAGAQARYRQALGLRACLTRLLTDQPAHDDLAIVDRYRRRDAAGRQLRHDVTGYALAWTGPVDLALVATRVVGSFVTLATSERIGLVNQCAGPRCGWLFVDESPGRRRRWCSMQDCGNRAKVRRFRSRR